MEPNQDNNNPAVENSNNKIDKDFTIKLILVALSLVILIIGVGAFIFRDNYAKQEKKNDDARISALEKKISEIENGTTPVTSSNVSSQQNNTIRKNDLSRISTGLAGYQSNNRGLLPKSLTSKNTSSGMSFIQSYVENASSSVEKSSLIDPKTLTEYVFLDPVADISEDLNLEIGQIAYQTESSCGDNGVIIKDSARKFTLRTVLEDQAKLYCINN